MTQSESSFTQISNMHYTLFQPFSFYLCKTNDSLLLKSLDTFIATKICILLSLTVYQELRLMEMHMQLESGTFSSFGAVHLHSAEALQGA